MLPDHNWRDSDEPNTCSDCPEGSLYADDPVTHLYVRLAKALGLI